MIRLALDWLPNTNHTGFYVAQAFNWYSEAGIEVCFLSPHVDGYKTTPAAKVRTGAADVAIAPPETVISSHSPRESWAAPVKLKAVAALLQDDTSAIVTLESSGIDRPAKLDGCVYASYGARYEVATLKQMIVNDGGSGSFVETSPGMLSVWDTLLTGQADATWVFTGWEGIQARRAGIGLHAFRLQECGIPYAYPLLLVTSEHVLRERGEDVRKFLHVTARGFAWAAEHDGQAAELLVKHAGPGGPPRTDLDMVRESQAEMGRHYLDGQARWGAMEEGRWSEFLAWLDTSGLLHDQRPAVVDGPAVHAEQPGAAQPGQAAPLDARDLFTNGYL